jgi:hypothetical protein
LTRTYECLNRYCANFAHRVIVRGRQNDTLWEFPQVVCACGSEPAIVGPMTIDSGDAFIEKYFTPELIGLGE